MSTESVIKHHVQALADGDLDGIMADYAEDAVFISNDNVIKGLDGIRQVFKGATAAGGMKVEVHHETYDGNVCYLVFSLPGAIDFGADTFIVENDKITLQTSAVKMAG